MAQLPLLPLAKDIETKAVLRAAAQAHRYLAELKGAAELVPNESILISSLGIQEAKDSSEIENIVTTHDEIYKFDLGLQFGQGPAAKEVQRYVSALMSGHIRVLNNRFLRTADIKDLNNELTGNQAGFRTLPGTALKNKATGKVVYTPPQDPEEINKLVSNFVLHLNEPSSWEIDPLVKMAVLHHQFESIHPFYDGNGRTGRIINILFLCLNNLLDSPIQYLSRYIVQNKSKYYQLLQETRESGHWEPWILYMLEGVSKTAKSTLHTTRGIAGLMGSMKHRLKEELPSIYSHELINNLFYHPYTKIEFVMQDLSTSRNTASNYLHKLVLIGVLTEIKVGRSKIFINEPLLKLLKGVEEL